MCQAVHDQGESEACFAYAGAELVRWQLMRMGKFPPCPGSGKCDPSTNEVGKCFENTWYKLVLERKKEGWYGELRRFLGSNPSELRGFQPDFHVRDQASAMSKTPLAQVRGWRKAKNEIAYFLGLEYSVSIGYDLSDAERGVYKKAAKEAAKLSNEIDLLASIMEENSANLEKSVEAWSAPWDNFEFINSDVDVEWGGHGVALVGILELDSGGTPGGLGSRDHSSGYYVFKNSWGPGWGQQGYGIVPCDKILIGTVQALKLEREVQFEETYYDYLFL